MRFATHDVSYALGVNGGDSNSFNLSYGSGTGNSGAHLESMPMVN